MRLVLVLTGMLMLTSLTAAQFREGEATGTGTMSLAGAEPSVDSSAFGGATDGEKLLYLTGAAMGYALFDYVGYNSVRNDHTGLVVYRVLQGLVQLGISWLLYEELGLPTAIGFNVLWWTWGIDAMFYGYTELFNVGGSWQQRGVFRKHILDNNCSWASWTPVGLVQGADPQKKIAGDTIIAQSILGAILAVTITLQF